jgi:Flp pilus assembly protein TadG
MKSVVGNASVAKSDCVVRRNWRRMWRIVLCEDGGALVEAAFVLPVLILVMLGIFQISMYATIATGTQSAALTASQTFAGSRGATGAAVNAATAAVNAAYCSSIWKTAPTNIAVTLYVNNSSGVPVQCSTCTGTGSSINCATPPTTSATCTGSCDTALTNAAPNTTNSTYFLSSVSVQNNCTGLGYVRALSTLVCPVSSRVYGVVE